MENRSIFPLSIHNSSYLLSDDWVHIENEDNVFLPDVVEIVGLRKVHYWLQTDALG